MSLHRYRWVTEETKFPDAVATAAARALRSGKTRVGQAHAAAEALWKLRGQNPPENWEAIKMEALRKEAAASSKPSDPVEIPVPVEDGLRELDVEVPEMEPEMEPEPVDDEPVIDQAVVAVQYRRWQLAIARISGRGDGRQFDALDEWELDDIVALRGRVDLAYESWCQIRFAE